MARPHDIRHERRPGGRCVWCWEALPAIDHHTVVASPLFDGRALRFHHGCWATFLTLSPALADGRGTGFEVTPENLERLRIEAGLTLTDLRKKLGISFERLVAILSGERTALSENIVRAAKALAADTQFGRGPRGRINWSSPSSVFSLRMHAGKTQVTLARDLGTYAPTWSRWEVCGVPKSSLRTRQRLDELATAIDFDRGMVQPDRDWTAEWLAKAVAAAEAEGVSRPQFAAACGTVPAAIHHVLAGGQTVGRLLAWRLSRGAARLGLPLPPVVEPSRWAPLTAAPKRDE